MSRLIIKVTPEEKNNPFASAFICFYEEEGKFQELKWVLQGKFDGYEEKNGDLRGYVTMPINGYEEKVFQYTDEVSESGSNKFPKQDKKKLRIIWNFLIAKGFEEYDVDQYLGDGLRHVGSIGDSKVYKDSNDEFYMNIQVTPTQTVKFIKVAVEIGEA
jgi:hypothetical protein